MKKNMQVRITTGLLAGRIGRIVRRIDDLHFVVRIKGIPSMLQVYRSEIEVV